MLGRDDPPLRSFFSVSSQPAGDPARDGDAALPRLRVPGEVPQGREDRTSETWHPFLSRYGSERAAQAEPVPHGAMGEEGCERNREADPSRSFAKSGRPGSG